VRRPARPGALAIVAALLLLGPEAIAKPAARPELTVVGHVTVTTRRVPHCGTGAFGMKVRYQVDEVVAGDYKERFVDVIVGCPEMFPIRFAVGTRARLELTREGRRPKMSWAFSGDLPAPRFPQYWLVTATQSS
jgi:hypothetical protein